MAIPQRIRDELLVEAQHRCTICSEPCYEIHHIVEQQNGGSDAPENLIVLCPNCHQHRIHRTRQITPAQVRMYKQKLKDKNEIERRLLQNLDAIRRRLVSVPIEESERLVRNELANALSLVAEGNGRENLAIEHATRYLAERDLLRSGARRALEIEHDLDYERRLKQHTGFRPVRIDDATWKKAPDFPDAYSFEIVLSGLPSSDWAQTFNEHYERSTSDVKPKISIRGNRLRMVVGEEDDLQRYVDYAKGVIKSTNVFMRDLVKRNVEREKLKSLREFDAIQSLKKRTRRISL